MDNRGRNTDRADPLRQLQQGSARDAPQVLFRHLQECNAHADSTDEGSGRGNGARHGDAEHMIAECEWCAGPLPESATARRMYCCVKCRNAAFNALISQARAEARKGRICPMCSGPVPDDRKADTIYCSSLCQGRSRRDRERHTREKTCERCGKPFLAHEDSQRYCSQACYHQPRLIRPKSCEGCGKTFTPKRKDARFCGRSCSTAAQWASGGMKLPPRAYRGKGARFLKE